MCDDLALRLLQLHMLAKLVGLAGLPFAYELPCAVQNDEPVCLEIGSGQGTLVSWLPNSRQCASTAGSSRCLSLGRSFPILIRLRASPERRKSSFQGITDAISPHAPFEPSPSQRSRDDPSLARRISSPASDRSCWLGTRTETLYPYAVDNSFQCGDVSVRRLWS